MRPSDGNYSERLLVGISFNKEEKARKKAIEFPFVLIRQLENRKTRKLLSRYILLQQRFESGICENKPVLETVSSFPEVWCYNASFVVFAAMKLRSSSSGIRCCVGR